MSITINISRASVLADMKVTSHAEVAALPDDRERYLAELGTEKEPIAHQAITDASKDIQAVLRRYLSGLSDSGSPYSDSYDTAETIAYTLDVSPRKAGMGEPLTKAIHEYIVESALAKFYDRVHRTDFSQVHLARIASPLATMNSILYRKLEPTYTT